MAIDFVLQNNKTKQRNCWSLKKEKSSFLFVFSGLLDCIIVFTFFQILFVCLFEEMFQQITSENWSFF